ELGAVDGPLVLADEEHARVGDGFVEDGALLLVHELCLGLLQAIEGVGRTRVLSLVGMYEKRLFAICDLDVGLGHTWVEVEDGIPAVRTGVSDICPDMLGCAVQLTHRGETPLKCDLSRHPIM